MKNEKQKAIERAVELVEVQLRNAEALHPKFETTRDRAIAVLMEEWGEVGQAWVDGKDNLKEELAQVGAVLLRIAKHFGMPDALSKKRIFILSKRVTEDLMENSLELSTLEEEDEFTRLTSCIICPTTEYWMARAMGNILVCLAAYILKE